jgi:release factor glutamine methyltransferase
MYMPAEDTYFIEDYIKNESGHNALDIGSGSGYLTKSLKKTFSNVIGTDINYPILCTQAYKTENIICCNGADALNLKFDLIICNLPYLATDEIIDIATDGGNQGVEIPLKIIKSAIPRLKPISGKFIFVTSSLSNFTKLIEEIQNMGNTKVKILDKKKLFFEELILIQVTTLYNV